ncbi:hypothetical protein IWW37_000124 [Coemansia sp. RSA 2050]|nr:hypothetical protein IWW37_000124 [Coemansia sp. RSA 2050]
MSVVSSTRLCASSDSNPQSAVSSTFSSPNNSHSSGNSDDGEDGMERPAKRFKSDSPNTSESGLTSVTPIDSVEHQGQRYFVGDHVILDDADNTSGVLGTELPAVGHIQQLERDAQTGRVQVSVVWYVYPQLTPHPPLMEFFKNGLLRTARQTTVPLERVKRPCFVVQPAEAMVGHPAEYVEGVPLFVCESRFNDKGGSIQKIKHRVRGFWPTDMDQKRLEMLTTMVAWSGGPRELEKSLVPVVVAGEELGDGAPQTRRSSRLIAPAAAAVSTPPRVSDMRSAANAMPQTVPVNQSQYLAYQQMLVQSQIQPLSGVNGQQQASSQFALNGANVNSVTAGNGPLRNAGAMPASPTPPLPLVLPPKRRGRPPKNKQLIEQRAKEDAAKMVEIAALIQTPPGSQLRSSTRQQQQQQSTAPGVRPPPPPGFGMHNGSPGGARGIAPNGVSPAQLLAARVQPVAPAIVPPPSLPQQKMAQQKPVHLVPLPHDTESVAKLPKEIVDLFPKTDGKLKWFATLPACRTARHGGVRHSDAYVKWKQSQSGA